jgi:hypothetical protein
MQKIATGLPGALLFFPVGLVPVPAFLIHTPATVVTLMQTSLRSPEDLLQREELPRGSWDQRGRQG